MFETILYKIGIGIVTVAITVAGFLGYSPESETPMGTEIPVVVALFKTTLAVKITSAGTSMTLTSGTTKDTTTLSGFYGFIIDEGTASEEFVTASCTDTACSSMTRGISAITGNTEVGALKKAHRRGGSVKITNHPVLAIMARIMNGDETFPNTLKYASNPSFASSTAIVDKNYSDTTFVGLTGNQTIAGVKYFSSIPTATSTVPTADIELTTKKWIDDNFVNASSTQTIKGVKTFNSFSITPSAAPTTNYQVSNKKYIDDIAIAGAPNASTTLQGLVEIATDAEVKAASSTGATGAQLVVNPSDLSNNYVNSSSTQTIKGIKTFETLPQAPTSTTSLATELITKYYADSFGLTDVNIGKVAFTGAGQTHNLVIGFVPKIILFFADGSNQYDGVAKGSADADNMNPGPYANRCFLSIGADAGNEQTSGKVTTWASTSVVTTYKQQATELAGNFVWVALK